MSDEADRALLALLPKLEAWLKVQPEWPWLFLADRQTRRKAARELAKAIETIPTTTPAPEQLSRSVRRLAKRLAG